MFLVTMIAPWVLKALLGAGLSEASAGRFVASRVFGPLVMLLAAGGLLLAGWKGVPALIKIHDARIAGVAKRECVASIELQLAQAHTRALQDAVAQANETIRARNFDLDRSKAREEQLEKEKADALSRTKDPDAVVVPPDDPWLQRYRAAR